MIAVLWTDALVWLLVMAIAVYCWQVRRKEHLTAPWRRVGSSHAGMASLVVLGAFVIVGLLDSLHFRPRLEGKQGEDAAVYAVELRSVFDVLVAPLRTRTETSYSAPFALHGYTKETIELGGGKVAREFPRLLYGGAHLGEGASQAADIALRAMGGVALGIALGSLATILATAGLARRARVSSTTMWRRIRHGEAGIAWRAVYAALLVMSIVVCTIAVLAARYHVLGTDKVGQDVLYLALKSVRTALLIGGLTTLVLLPLAVLLGVMAGYFRGWVDDLIQYIYTTLNSIPSVLLIAAAVLMVQVYIDTHPDVFPTTAHRADLRLLFLCIILGLTSWTGLARLLRGETLKLRELEYIQAAHAFGVRDVRIITRHLLPNVMHLIIIALVMDFSGFVLTEAVLSYVGVGVDPSMMSFGTMINAARLEMAREPMVWWTLASAFVFMFLIVLSANLLADAVRDAFDPRTRLGRMAAPPSPATP